MSQPNLFRPPKRPWNADRLIGPNPLSEAGEAVFESSGDGLRYRFRRT